MTEARSGEEETGMGEAPLGGEGSGLGFGR